MTLFGHTLDPQAISSLAFLLMLLVLWVSAMRDDRDWRRWFTGRDADGKSRRRAEQAGDAPPPSSEGPRGPWG